MALLAVPIVVGATAAAAVAISVSDTSDDHIEKKKLRRAIEFKARPLNALTVKIETSGIKAGASHLGVTVRRANCGYGVAIDDLCEADLVAQAGLQVNDWILKINGQIVEDDVTCMTIVNGAIERGETIEVEYMSQKSATVDLSALHLKGSDQVHLGLSLRTEPGERGALVTEVNAGDVIAEHGLLVGDVITHVGDRRVYSHEDAMEELTQRNWFKQRKNARIVEIKYMTADALKSCHPAVPIAIPVDALEPVKAP